MTFIADFITFWITGGIFVFAIDWTQGFPRCLADPTAVAAYTEHRRRLGDKDPRRTTVLLLFCVLMILGPFGIMLDGISPRK